MLGVSDDGDISHHLSDGAASGSTSTTTEEGISHSTGTARQGIFHEVTHHVSHAAATATAAAHSEVAFQLRFGVGCFSIAKQEQLHGIETCRVGKLIHDEIFQHVTGFEVLCENRDATTVDIQSDRGARFGLHFIDGR